VVGLDQEVLYILPTASALRFNLILSSHLHSYLPNGFLTLVAGTKILYAFVISPMRATPSTYCLSLDREIRFHTRIKQRVRL